VQGVRKDPPVLEILRDGVAYGGAEMSQLLLHEGAWRLEVENVVVCAVSRQPEIPHPLFS
jgi:hypothetical protein